MKELIIYSLLVILIYEFGFKDNFNALQNSYEFKEQKSSKKSKEQFIVKLEVVVDNIQSDRVYVNSEGRVFNLGFLKNEDITTLNSGDVITVSCLYKEENRLKNINRLDECYISSKKSVKLALFSPINTHSKINKTDIS